MNNHLCIILNIPFNLQTNNSTAFVKLMNNHLTMFLHIPFNLQTNNVPAKVVRLSSPYYLITQKYLFQVKP